MKMNKDMRTLISALEDQGFVLKSTRRGHLMVYLDGRLVTTMAGNPGDVRSIRNAVAYLRKAGFMWPPPR